MYVHTHGHDRYPITSIRLGQVTCTLYRSSGFFAAALPLPASGRSAGPCAAAACHRGPSSDGHNGGHNHTWASPRPPQFTESSPLRDFTVGGVRQGWGVGVDLVEY